MSERNGKYWYDEPTQVRFCMNKKEDEWWYGIAYEKKVILADTGEVTDLHSLLDFVEYECVNPLDDTEEDVWKYFIEMKWLDLTDAIKG